MRLPRFEYLGPETLEDALDLLAEYKDDAKILAGGTDLLVRMKKGLLAPKVLISLKALNNLSYIRKQENTDSIALGATTPLADIIASDLIQTQATALSAACDKVGAVSLQHFRGTIGGNILQNTRCQHYNQSQFHRSGRQACHKDGGKICYARDEADRCYSTCQSDGATALMALGAKLVLSSKGNANKINDRTVDLADFYTTDGIVPFAMESHELLKEIIIPASGNASAYHRLAYRSAIDYPIVCAGVSLASSNNKIDEARIVVGAMGRSPLFLAKASSSLSGKDLTNKNAFQAAARQAKDSAEAFAVHNVGSTLEYRCAMVEEMVLRALTEAANAAIAK